MSSCSISFKIKDFNPKINSIPYKNYVCIIIYGDFQIKIPLLLNNDFHNLKHEIKNINWDLYYKITLFDNNLKELIGFSDLIIPFKLIEKTKPNNSLLYEKQIKFLIGMRTKIKLFGSLSKIGDIYLNMTIKIFKNPNKIFRSNNDNNNIINNYLINGLANRILLSKKKSKSRNLLKTKIIINKKIFNKNKNKHIISDMSPENNKFITLNDINNNIVKTYSLIDDNSIEDENNNFNNITNIINYNYYCLNTSSHKNTANNINFKKNINNKKNSIDNDKNSFFELNDLLEKRNRIKNKLNYNKNRNRENILKKNIWSQSRSKSKIKNLSSNKTEILTGSIRRRGLKWREKNKTNISNHFLNSNEDYSFDNYNLSIDPKTSKSKSIISKNKFTNGYNKNKIKLNKILLLRKEKKNNYTNTNSKIFKKNKNIPTNIFHRAMLSERINMSIDEENNFNMNNNNKIYSDIIKKTNKILNFNNKSYFKILNRNENTLKKNNSKNRNNNTFSHIKFLSRINKSENNDSNDSISFRRLENKIDNIIINKYVPNKNIIKIKDHNIYNISNDSYQNKIKNYELKLLQYFILNNLKLKSTYIKVKKNNNKVKFHQDLFLTSLKKSNKLEEKKSTLLIHNYILNNIKNSLNEKIKFPLMKIKKSEFKIYQKIFNLSYFDYDIIKYRDSEKKLNEKIINLELIIIQNLIKQYGNITQIFKVDKIKKEKLKNILRKNNIEEKDDINKNNYIDLFALNRINCSVKKIIKNTFNNDVKYKFNIIKEEDKESEKSNNTINNDIREEIFFIDKDNESDDNDENLYKIENVNIDYKNNFFCFNSPNNNNNNNILENNNNIKNKYIKKELNGFEKKIDYEETTDIDSENLEKKDIGFIWKRKNI